MNYVAADITKNYATLITLWLKTKPNLNNSSTSAATTITHCPQASTQITKQRLSRTEVDLVGQKAQVISTEKK